MASEAQKRAWTNYNHSQKKKAASKRYYESHKDILKEKHKEWDSKNRDKRKEYNRRNVQKRITSGKDKELRQRWKRERPEQLQAIDAANNALKRGGLKRKYKCEMCGKKGFLHKHHEDYDKPLEVMWLCPFCHKKIHRERTNERTSDLNFEFSRSNYQVYI